MVFLRITVFGFLEVISSKSSDVLFLTLDFIEDQSWITHNFGRILMLPSQEYLQFERI